MPTRNIYLSDEMDEAVNQRVKSGRYTNASEVLRAGLRALDQDEAEDRATLEWLRAEIQHGIDSGPVEGDMGVKMRQFIHDYAASRERKVG
jgi:antitoxin ParD1/3/4